jgi:hypothetical protein
MTTTVDAIAVNQRRRVARNKAFPFEFGPRAPQHEKE